MKKHMLAVKIKFLRLKIGLLVKSMQIYQQALVKTQNWKHAKACMQTGKMTDILLRRRDFKEKSARILSVFGAFLTMKELFSVETD